MSLDASEAVTRSSLPTGTVTFVFTDIEGSTERWERDRDAMQEALHRHDTILRSAITTHGGVVFKTFGDAFCAAFRRPDDAVVCALDAQRALTREDFSRVGGLRVRMALHSGSAEERDGDYYGPTLNRVARILAIGHGGQILLSATTAQFERQTLVSSAELRDLGEHHLKDLAQPERVFQLVAADLPSEFPPLRSLSSLPQNLPTHLASFVGRDEEIHEISDLLVEHRVVTIVGAGGVGKTRTSLEVAARALGAYDDGVWLVELAPLRDASLIAATVARTLNLRLTTDEDQAHALASAIGQLELLLVLDNCEHVVSGAVAVASAIVQHCPRVTILATSRQPLDIEGEMTYRLPSLPLASAMELFEVRAKAADRRFALNAKTEPIVADICERLDGIALAIELAAARVSVLTPDQLQRRLDERFSLLTSGRRDALPRQQTMRAVIDWSYDLLTDEERALLRRSSIFSGGWTLEAIESVCDAGSLDTLSSLVEKSLVIAERTYDETRYRLQESTRAYAFEKLHDAAETEEYAARHARWACEFAQRADARSYTAPLHEWRPPVQRETENVRAALSWALDEEGDPQLGARIVAALELLWATVPLKERAHWTDMALEHIDQRENPEIAATLCIIRATSCEAGKERAATARRAIDLLSVRGTHALLGRAYAILGDAYNQMGRYDDALAANDRAREILRAAGFSTLWPYAQALGERGLILGNLGRLDEGVAAFEQALAINEGHGDVQRCAIVRADYAEFQCARGQFDHAVELAQSVLDAYPDQNFHRIQVHVRINLAAYHLLLGHVEQAESLVRSALPLAKRFGIAPNVAVAIAHIATAAALRGEFVRAATLRGYSDRWYADRECARESTEVKTYALLMTALQASLSEEDLEAYAREGAALTEDEAISLALRG